MRVSPLAFPPVQVGVIRIAIFAALLASSVSLLSGQASAQQDVMNALGVPYSPAMEHALQESDRQQIYGDAGRQPQVPLLEYLTSPHLQKQAEPEEEGLNPYLPSNDFNSPIGEIDESLMQKDACPSGTTPRTGQGESLNPDDQASSCEPMGKANPALSQPVVSKQSHVKANKPVAPAKSKQASKPQPSLPTSEAFPAAVSSDPANEKTESKENSVILEAPPLIESSVSQEKMPEQMATSIQAKQVSTTAVHIGGYIPAEKILPVAFINTKGQQILPAKAYAHICNFSYGLACVMIDPKQELASSETTNITIPQKPVYGYFNAKGQWAIPPVYSLAGDFKPVDKTPDAPIFARAQWLDRNDQLKWGYVNNKGENIIANQYDWASDFSEGMAIVAMPVEVRDQPIGQQYGYINTKGETVIKPQYEEAEPFKDGLAKVWDGKLNPHGWPQYTFIKPTGEVAMESPFDWISSFQNGYARVGNLGDARDQKTASTTPTKFGYMNSKGQVLVPIQFDSAWPFVSVTNNQLIALFKQNGQYGYIRPTGDLAFPQRYDWADEFHENLAAIKVGGHYGFIDPQGKTVIKPQFDWVGAFSNGLAPVAKKTEEGMRYGFINKAGKVTIPLRYAWVLPFSGNLAQVR